MGEEKNLMVTRFICSIISVLFCFVLIILYLGHIIYNSKSNKQITKLNNNQPKDVLSSQLSLPVTKAKQNNKQGIGNHYIFLLTLSNFLFGLTNIWTYLSYKNNSQIIYRHPQQLRWCIHQN